MKPFYDTVVVGAGPAGLGFCASAANRGSILLLEAGKPLNERDSSRPEEIGTGVAGAGAFIDGKLSSFPAGTAAYETAYPLLKAGYDEMAHHMAAYAPELPPCPTEQEIADYFFNAEAIWKLKKYPSFYMDESKRFEFLHRLIEHAQEHAQLVCNAQVLLIDQRVSTSWEPGNFEITVFHDQRSRIVRCSRVVLAGGRFMPLQKLLPTSPWGQKFRRHEFGIRLQLPKDNAAVLEIGSGGLDPKFVIEPMAGVQYRTFCFCRQGQVCQSNINGLLTYSGRADVAPTELTNFGLMARTNDPTAFTAADLDQFLAKPFNITSDFESELKRFGKVGEFIWHALSKLFEQFPALNCSELSLVGPCLEGVGNYPNVDSHLRVNGIPNLFAIGDTSGTFRGLVPSLLSGYYLAHAIQFNDSAPLLLTSNPEKVLEIKAALGPLESSELRGVDAILESNAEVHARLKAELALEQRTDSELLLIEVSSLEIDDLHAYPGVHVGEFFKSLGTDKICAIAEGSAATFLSILVLVNTRTNEMHQFKGSVRGTIVKPSGSNGFHWDCLFRPNGYNVTYGDMDRRVKMKISARFHAAKELSKFLAP